MGRRGMGKRNRGGQEGGDRDSKRARTDSGNDRNFQLTNFILASPIFEGYYQRLPGLTEEEFPLFLATLRTDLPSTFRVNESNSLADYVKSQFAAFRTKMEGLTFAAENGEPQVVPPPSPIAWYRLRNSSSGEGAWKFTLAKRHMKKAPGVEEFRAFIIQQNDLGTITRQEEVSMLPPLFMDVEPHHYVLDLCAAPGSKTVQLIEMLHQNSDGSLCIAPPGVVIANDVDRSRCNLLDHQPLCHYRSHPLQIKRVGSPNTLLLNYQAQKFPEIGSTNPLFPTEKIRFDRILCDVPCSGDGTLRKSPEAWAKWTPMSAAGLHGVQLSIALRAYVLLKVGGRMVYSTCSMNPVEDEAVLAELLRRTQGTLQLVDVSHRFPELKRRNGLSSWPGFMTKDGVWFEKHGDLPAELKWKVAPTVFPPSAEEAAGLNLHRSFRVLPHDQDTGGFFVAVLEKTGDIDPFKKKGKEEKKDEEKKEDEKKEEKQEEVKEGGMEGEDGAPEGALEEKIEKSAKETSWQKRGKKKEEDDMETGAEGLMSFSLHSTLQAEWVKLRDFYGFTPAFPHRNLMFRQAEGRESSDARPHRVLYTSDSVHDIVTDRRNQNLKLINVGLRVLMEERFPNSISYRIAQEGINCLFPYLDERRVVKVTKADLAVLLHEGSPYTFKLTPEAQTSLAKISSGPCFFVYVPEGPAGTEAGSRLVCSGSRANQTAKIQMKDQEKKLLSNMFLPIANTTQAPEKMEQKEVAANEEKGGSEMRDGGDPDAMELA